MGRSTKAAAEQTRLRILQAAAELFSKKGYDRATFEDIAAKIGLTKGAVYWHFKSKPELLLALIAFMSDRAWVCGALTAPDSLEALTEHFVMRGRQIADSPLDSRFFLMMRSLNWKSATFAPVKQRLSEIVNSPAAIIRGTLATLLKEGRVRVGTNLCLVTSVLLSIWYGSVENAIVGYVAVDLETSVRFGFNTVLERIKL